MKYKCIKQYDSTDCASACLASISWHYGKKISVVELSEILEINKKGTSIFDLCETAEKIGLSASAYKKNEKFDIKELELPCIAHVYQEDGLAHFIVIYKIKKDKVIIADPAIGIIKVDKTDFFQSKSTENSPYYWTGIIVTLKVNRNFYQKTEEIKSKKSNFLELINGEQKNVSYIIFLSGISMGFSIITSFYFGILIDEIIPNRLIYQKNLI